MREFFLKMFRFDGGPVIDVFSGWHFMYIILIVGLTIGLAFWLNLKSPPRARDITLKVLAISGFGLYMADFFIMPLARTSGDIDIDKLPFHICTLMSIMMMFAQFNKKMTPTHPFKEAVTCLSLVSTLMYITYPGSALGDIGTFSYKVVQTFAFHGCVFSWAVISLTTGATVLNFKNIYKPIIGICIVIVWAWFGNSVYSSSDRSFDWFFVTGSMLDVHPALMTFIVLAAVSAMCAIIYSIDLGVKHVIKKVYAKKADGANVSASADSNDLNDGNDVNSETDGEQLAG